MSIAEGPQGADPRAGEAQQIVTFKIDDRAFGVPVGSVREIRGWQKTTPLPNSASHVLGVINLRGAIVAIYDLRQRLGLDPSPLSRASVVVVIDMGERCVGLLVDAVSDIIDIHPQDLRPAPETSRDGEGLLRALVVRGAEVISLLELGALVGEGHAVALAA
ncbi:chemotaxis protein CheW [Alsobacter sp. SYSU M60028]|uniref:Chemotaxis protein CheW n=1 Tax=Alsobacter ponti TaxID=2962936 RepID=A0ABT1LDI6_9HYPH|nr:chemotaxis protein CheW [Alsobacter ponti]MCP8939161.1 chemotaxis protein CheW [Alsobacter ponti]